MRHRQLAFDRPHSHLDRKTPLHHGKIRRCGQNTAPRDTAIHSVTKVGGHDLHVLGHPARTQDRDGGFGHGTAADEVVHVLSIVEHLLAERRDGAGPYGAKGAGEGAGNTIGSTIIGMP